MSKINPKSLVSILTVICIVISMICSKPIRAVTEGRGARIVIWDEWGQAKFHIGMTPGSCDGRKSAKNFEYGHRRTKSISLVHGS